MKRTEHCAFKMLNANGRCIASCIWNTPDTDCIGETGKTMDSESKHEVQIMGGVNTYGC